MSGLIPPADHDAKSTAQLKPRTNRLKGYRDKRNFHRTAEPKSRIGRRKGWQFVVQRHDARRLHFDLRLELDGVLKSWAVTRGPSLNPEDKRLAVETEDHPLGYLEWEGVIPKGEYGGGTMIVWDRGTWRPGGDPRKDLEKGHLEFALEGSRLKGRWHLVRMQRNSRDKRQPWLLIKGKDEHARQAGEPDIVVEATTSKLSGRTNAELAAYGHLRSDHAARAKAQKAVLPDAAKLAGAKKGLLPVFVAPALAELADAAPSGPQWLHEIKYDGYRIQARIDGGKIKLLTRKGLDWTKRFPTIATAFKELPAGAALIDGEIVVQEANGLTSFSGLQADLKSGRQDRIACFVFDLLYFNGVDTRGVSLPKRKELLKSVLASLPEGTIIRYSDHLPEDGETVMVHACRMGMEGIISKRADLPYHSGRSEHWLKSKCVQRQEFVIVGYMPSSALKNAVGSLVLGYYDDGKLIHVGRAGTGFSAESAVELRQTLDKIATGKPALGGKLTAEAQRNVRWVAPKLVAEIEHRGLTHDGMLRQAAFKGLRGDKAPTEIVLETARSGRPQKRASSLKTFPLTHPDRILWPDVGITKQGLADFYADIASWILPHVTGRLLSLVRCPTGVEGECFYAKHAWQGIGDSIRLVPIGSDTMVAINDLDGLIALVQSGGLEIHPWGSRLESLETPDRMTIDLDPGEGVAWSTVIDAALEVRDRLKQFKLASFVKTTGGKGIHVVVPLQPEAQWPEVKAFAKSLAEAMQADQPRLYLATATKRARHGKIFVDYLRNGRGATAVAAYSTRAKAAAPVSVPLDWSELSEALRSDHFTVGNLRQRLEFLKADPWRGVFRVKQRIPNTQ